jgi:hypothetical protein
MNAHSERKDDAMSNPANFKQGDSVDVWADDDLLFRGRYCWAIGADEAVIYDPEGDFYETVLLEDVTEPLRIRD